MYVSDFQVDDHFLFPYSITGNCMCHFHLLTFLIVQRSTPEGRKESW